MTVYDDYAHHPTEVAAQLRAARDGAPGAGRVLVRLPAAPVSAAPRPSPTEFGAALGLADEVVVLDVYAAREDPVPGVTGALVADAVPLPAERVLVRAGPDGGGRPSVARRARRATS